MDNASIYVQSAAWRALVNERVDVITLPAGLTQTLQPLDLMFNKTLNSHLADALIHDPVAEVRKARREGQPCTVTLDIPNIIAAIGRAYKLAVAENPQLMSDGSRMAGIYPPDPSVPHLRVQLLPKVADTVLQRTAPVTEEGRQRMADHFPSQPTPGQPRHKLPQTHQHQHIGSGKT